MPPEAPAIPAILQARINAAAKRLAARAPQPAPAAPAPKPTPTPTAKPTAPTAKPTTTPKAAKRAGTREEKGEAQRGGAAPQGVADRLRAMARNPDALSMVSDAQLAAIWSAMVDNAALRGSTGAMDRQALFRAAGLPFQGGIGAAGGGKGGKGDGPAVSDRLERALSRVARRRPVTDDEGEGDEPADPADCEGEAHKIGGHVPVGPGRPDPDEGGQPPHQG